MTYPDGSKDEDTFDVTVGEPSKTTADETTPDWKDKETPAGEPVEVPNEGDKLPEGSEVTPKSDKDWDVTVGDDGKVTVTPPADAKPGDKSTITVEVTYPDGSKDTDEFVVEVGEPDPNWDDAETPGDGKPVEIPNNGGEVPDGTTVEVEGPGTAKIKDDGTLVVTPSEDAKPGDEITVIVKDKDGNELDKVKVTVGDDSDDNGGSSIGDNGSSEPADIGKCIAAGVGLGLPLLLLAPLGLAGQVNLPGVSQWQAQIEPQIRELNTRLQQEAGVFNPELARMAEEFNAQMARPEVRAAVGGIGLLLAGLAIGGIMLNACAPEGGWGSSGSSDLKPIGSGENESEGSSQPETEAPADEANGEDTNEEEVTDPEAEEATDEDTTDPEA